MSATVSANVVSSILGAEVLDGRVRRGGDDSGDDCCSSPSSLFSL